MPRTGSPGDLIGARAAGRDALLLLLLLLLLLVLVLLLGLGLGLGLGLLLAADLLGARAQVAGGGQHHGGDATEGADEQTEGEGE